jgi:hypothetical protein
MKEAEQAELKMIETLFLQMGAAEEQAKVMASQLYKRAGQIASERDISIVEAVEILLKQVIEARSGG